MRNRESRALPGFLSSRAKTEEDKKLSF